MMSTTTTAKLDFRCPGNECERASKCRRYIPYQRDCQIPMSAFDIRDKPDGQCDGYVPRIMEPIRVESEGGEQ